MNLTDNLAFLVNMENVVREGVKRIGLCPKCDKQPKKQNWEKLLILMIAVNLMIVVNQQIF